MALTETITAVAEPAAEQAGLVVDHVSVTTTGGEHRVLVTVDLPEDETGSADIDAVADASRRISAALDDADVVDGTYTLEVSTPGIDRPLTLERHFKRARTRIVRLDMKDGTAQTGRLTEAGGGSISLETDAGSHEIELADVAAGYVQVEMRKKK